MPKKPRRPLEPGPPPRQRPLLDEVDAVLVRELTVDARLSNAALAQRAGIAESTCSARVRSLVRRGVIRGFTTVLDPAGLGAPVRAMVAVRLSGHDMAQVDAFGEQVSQLPGVLEVWNVSGADDFVVQIACGSPDELRDFVLTHLSSRSGVVHVQTSLIFRSHRGRGVPIG
ncbi:Lrp/AsnC family transcriptional regulator [Naumannella sp. ID2617S]|uniref:AsnC family transcriptional regulator n=1 Tax=Enemella dayhoffiae TaxID=2016507 RepID=A0A255GWX2_9ACTN|nr:Lrp/AsnC family transcriptional regulator [Enemella dayhoffiae]NNG18270.1 Lrp/AsnC family transcriptional regulator [Naumannella sp. ID2617S]OYO18074.1 AsnC family transcriptional regulator [Enemella dayhoffiae]